MEADASKVSTFQLPDSHVLVAAGDELGFVIGVEFYSKHWIVAGALESNASSLLPLEDLHREGLIHANRDQ